MRMAQIVRAALLPHTRQQIDANDYMLFPDDAHDLPDDVNPQERGWMLKLNRAAPSAEKPG